MNQFIMNNFIDILESVAKQTKEEQIKKDKQMNDEKNKKNEKDIKQEKNLNQDLQFLFQALNDSFVNESKTKNKNQSSNVPDNQTKQTKEDSDCHQCGQLNETETEGERERERDFAFNFDLNFMNPIKEQKQNEKQTQEQCEIPFCMGENLSHLFSYQLYELFSHSSFEYKLTMLELVSRFFFEFTSHLQAEHKRQKSMK